MVGTKVVYPGVAYLELTLSQGKVSGDGYVPTFLEDVRFLRMWILAESPSTKVSQNRVRIRFTYQHSGAFEISSSSKIAETQKFTTHADG